MLTDEQKNALLELIESYGVHRGHEVRMGIMNPGDFQGIMEVFKKSVEIKKEICQLLGREMEE